MPLARIADTILHFAHVPKTGGSSVEAYMERKGVVALRHNRSGRWARTTPQHMPAHVAERFVNPAFYDHAFVILRDPEARILSTFRMRISRDHDRANPLVWLGLAWARLRGREAYAIRVWRIRLSLDFETWLRLVLLWRRRDPYIYDGHLLAQADYMSPGQTVFAFEDGLDPVFRWIDRVTGTPPAPTAIHEKKAPDVAVDCPPAARAMIRRAYAEDYALIARHRDGGTRGAVGDGSGGSAGDGAAVGAGDEPDDGAGVRTGDRPEPAALHG